MEPLRSYDTVTDAIKDLVNRGFIADLLMVAKIEFLKNGRVSMSLSPLEFQIVETYRFEGNTDPGDEMIVFAIASTKGDIKGIVTNGYGMYYDAESAKLIELLNHPTSEM